MANPLDALNFREVYGRTLRRSHGHLQAFQVAPISNDMTHDEVETLIRNVQISLIRCIDYGEVFYVSREMVELMTDLMAGRLQGPKLFHVDVGDLPSLTGFVYFDGPIPIPTIYSPTGYQNLRAIAWDQYSIARDASDQVLAYHGGAEQITPQLHEPEVIGKIIYSICDTPNEQQRDQYGRWKTRHWIPAEFGVRIDPTHFGERSALDDSAFRDLDLSPEEVAQDERDTVEGFDTLFKVLTMWMGLIQQEIPVRHPSDSNHDKVMQREGRPPGIVKITHLRRYAQSTTDGVGQTLVNWAYRWEVRGHFRNQRVGPGRTLLKKVWVPRHIKGPAGKPLVIRDSIVSLDR